MRTILLNIVYAFRWWIGAAIAVATIAWGGSHWLRLRAEQSEARQAALDAEQASKQRDSEERRAKQAEQERIDAADAAEEAARHESESRIARYVALRAPARSATTTNVGVVVSRQDAMLDQTAADRIARALEGEAAVHAVRNLFTSSFTQDGLFDALFDGDRSELRKLKLAEHVDQLILVRERLETAANTSVEGTYSSHLELQIQFLEVSTGVAKRSFAVNSVGAGTDEQSAVLMARERALEQLETRLAQLR